MFCDVKTDTILWIPFPYIHAIIIQHDYACTFPWFPSYVSLATIDCVWYTSSHTKIIHQQAAKVGLSAGVKTKVQIWLI